MARKTLPPRSEIAEEHTWNAPSVFATRAAWHAEYQSVLESLEAVEKFKGHLSDSQAKLAEWLETYNSLYSRVRKLGVYTSLASNVDTDDEEAVAMSGQTRSITGQMMAATAFAKPEMLEIGQETLLKWVADEPSLALYAHFVDDLFRQQAHTRSAEVEEVLGMVADPFATVYETANMLTNADIQYQPAVSSQGESLPVTPSNLPILLNDADRETRRTAWEHFTDGYLGFKNTLASNYIASVKQDVFMSRVRRQDTALESTLFGPNVPVEVFHNLIDTYRKNLPTWQRYWAIRRRALDVETLHPYDIWAPLTDTEPEVPYTQGVDWICQGMKPLGEDYVKVLRRGCLEERWVDIYPNQGKRQGAFSSGGPGTHPFIMLSYDDGLKGMSTLAHELGHSLHSYLTWKHNPPVYSRYSMFVAEVASNFNQAMTREYLFQQNDDPNFQIALIEEAMGNFHRYFFIMPTLARFELEVHTRIEQGKGVTAADLIGIMTDFFSEGYGEEMHVDHDRVGITWATFNHLYVAYYTFQYATGISAAHALAKNVLAGESGAVDNYLAFLKSGASLYPVDALKVAGVDMSQPDAVETTFAVLADYVDRLDTLTK
jgi:oligoendopeptidase F